MHARTIRKMSADERVLVHIFFNRRFHQHTPLLPRHEETVLSVGTCAWSLRGGMDTGGESRERPELPYSDHGTMRRYA